MHLPSLRVLSQEGWESFRRFSLVLIVACIGTFAASYLIEYDSITTALQAVMLKLLLSSLLGIPLCIALTVAAEKASLSLAHKSLLLGGAVILLLLYYVSMPANIDEAPVACLIRTAVFAFALHLLVSFAPFLSRGQVNAFWEYNKILFLRLLTSGLYTFVLWAGLSIALAAIERLFDLQVPGQRFAQLFAILAGLFNTWFFVAGIPRDFSSLDAGIAYPKGLKVFTQFVLLPLVTVYLVILYAYSARIMISWSWPQGWVSYLVLGFSITGMLSILLVYPVASREGNRFIARFSHYFYVALIPLTVLLFLAILERISDYGITERRYFVLMMAVWLAGMVIYFLASRKKSIKMIPVTLTILALLTTFGPWGFASVSEKSQMDRLSRYLTIHQILVNGKIQRAVTPVPFDDAKQISSILRYVADVHGMEPLQPWFDIRLDTIDASSSDGNFHVQRATRVKSLAAHLGVRYIEEWQLNESPNRKFVPLSQSAIAVSGYRYMLRLPSLGLGPHNAIFRDGEETWQVRFDPTSSSIIINHSGATQDSSKFDVHALAEKLYATGRDSLAVSHLPAESLTIHSTTGSMNASLVFRNIQCTASGDTIRFTNGEADILIR